MLLLLVCITGAFLGLYFSVLVLLPTLGIASAIFIFLNFSWGFSCSDTIGDLLIPFVFFQASYMLGLLGRDIYLQIVARFNGFQSTRI
jgi:hypothetical protein